MKPQLKRKNNLIFACFLLLPLFMLVACKEVDVNLTQDKKFDQIDRFKLYKTDNMWNFLLLDSVNGRVWQCQYSVEKKEGYKYCAPISLSDKLLSEMTIGDDVFERLKKREEAGLNMK